MENAKQPASPIRSQALEGGHTEIGLTKREYFAAHAPKIVPEWFEPKVPQQPKVRPYMFNAFGKGSDHPMSELYRKYYDDENEMWNEPGPGVVPSSFKIEVEQYLEGLREELAIHENWQQEVKLQRWVQWPWYWADQILNNKPE